MFKQFALAVLATAGAFAQLTPPIAPIGPEPSLALRQYLDLTNEQVVTVVRLNNDLLRYQSDKLRRQAQVSLEISQELQRETLDPMAIGVRQVEMEAIRREVAAEQRRVAQQVQSSLTAAQRTKIQALQDVLRSYPIACEAVASNLMSLPEPGVGTPGPGIIIGVISGVPFPNQVCAGAGIRSGSFSFLSGANSSEQK